MRRCCNPVVFYKTWTERKNTILDHLLVLYYGVRINKGPNGLPHGIGDRQLLGGIGGFSHRRHFDFFNLA